MPSLLPTIYRRASAILTDNPESSEERFSTMYACGAIKQAVKEYNKKLNKNIHPQPYLDFLFLVYTNENYSYYTSIWMQPNKERAMQRKLGLLFLANLLDSGMKPKDFQ